MGLLFQSADLTLNVAWLSLCMTTLLAWSLAGRRQRYKTAAVALLFILVLLFPVISTADDLAEQAMLYDVAPSPLSGKSIKEIKQFSALALPSGQTAGCLAGPLPWARSECQPDEGGSHRLVLLSSASGIHSPPLS